VAGDEPVALPNVLLVGALSRQSARSAGDWPDATSGRP
jgi:hypothetical protein